jgi:hypothetical protein
MRLEMGDGLSEEDIVDRLDAVRRSIPYIPSIQGLTDGLRRERDLEPFWERLNLLDISSELAKQFNGVCSLTYF